MAVGDTCSICHNVLTQAEHDAGDLTVAVCGNAHLFHTVCFRQWNAGHNTCPDCRNYVGAVGGGLFTPANRRELIDAVFAMMQNRRATLADLGPLRMWDTRLVTDFHQVFEYFQFEDQRPGGDDDITGWNTSAGQNMSGMFGRCSTFNQPLRFDTRAVRDISNMFSDCIAFNQPLRFDTRAVLDMSNMFSDCTAFNQPLNFSNTSNVTDMSAMFSDCTAFNQPLNFDTRAVTNMSAMFFYCDRFNQPLRFDTRAVLDMSNMFSSCTAFNQPLRFDTRAVLDMSSMFSSCTAFNQTLTFTDTGAVTNMSQMFTGCNVFNQPLRFDTRAVTNMSLMFANCTAFNQSLYKWFHQPRGNGRAVSVMFLGCTSFKSPVFPMSEIEFTESALWQTPLGRQDEMMMAFRSALMVPDDLAEQGRRIKFGSMSAANALNGRMAESYQELGAASADHGPAQKRPRYH